MARRSKQKTIKHPTIRKLKNRGITPLWYRTNEGCFTGWIEKRGRKWMWFRFTANPAKSKKIPLSEERYMEEIS